MAASLLAIKQEFIQRKDDIDSSPNSQTQNPGAPNMPQRTLPPTEAQKKAIEQGSAGDILSELISSHSPTTTTGGMPLTASSYPTRLRQRAQDEVDSRFPMMAVASSAHSTLSSYCPSSPSPPPTPAIPISAGSPTTSSPSASTPASTTRPNKPCAR